MRRGPRRQDIGRLALPAGTVIFAVGLGSVAAPILRELEPEMLIGGFLLHAWGMAEKHQPDRNALPRWVPLYFVCWVALVGFVWARACV